MIRNLILFALFIASTNSQRVKFSQTLIDPVIEGKTYPIIVSLDEPIICTGIDTVDMPAECRVTLIFDNPAPSTLSISPCFLEWTTRKTTTPDDEPEEDYYTEPPTQITYTPFKTTYIPSSTLTYIPDKPVRVVGSSRGGSGFPNYAFGIICGFVVVIMVIGALLYRRRYRSQMMHEDKLEQQFMMDFKSMEDKNLQFINPIFVKPEYMEVNPGLINPLYDALFNMQQGTYKVICTGADGEHILVVRGAKGIVESYPIRHRADKVILNSIYDTDIAIEFDSIDAVVNHFSTAEETYPLSCKLEHVCPEDMYSSGEVYGYNNQNIKNTPIEPDDN